MRAILLALLALGLATAAVAAPAIAPGAQVGPLGVRCAGASVAIDGTTLPPTASATPPACTVTGLPA